VNVEERVDGVCYTAGSSVSVSDDDVSHRRYGGCLGTGAVLPRALLLTSRGMTQSVSSLSPLIDLYSHSTLSVYVP